jgi:hypothetical protein
MMALLLLLFLGLDACDEQRFEIASNDKTPPGVPVLKKEPLPFNGGARLYYVVPDDEDVISVDAQYVTSTGQTLRFSASYFTDSLDIYGLSDTINYVVQLYAVDRAGNKSRAVPVNVKPLEAAIHKVAKTVFVKPSFGALFIDWRNELQQDVNVYVDFDFMQNGQRRNLTSVFSSNNISEHRFISNLNPEEPVNVRIQVGDLYGNRSNTIDMGKMELLSDSRIPKDKWSLPASNDSIAGIPQCYGSSGEARLRYVIDDIVDMGSSLNYMKTEGGAPWNLIIDLGDYYQLSRIVTHQRHGTGELELTANTRGNYYKGNNVGKYNMYILNEETNMWEYLSEHKIPIPPVDTELDFFRLGQAGDMAYMYPDYPDYTPPTRYFRYEALGGFDDNYSSPVCNDLSEVTLYGRPVK